MMTYLLGFVTLRAQLCAQIKIVDPIGIQSQKQTMSVASPGTDSPFPSRKNIVTKKIPDFNFCRRYKMYMSDGVEANSNNCFVLSTTGSKHKIASKSCSSNEFVLCQFECYSGNSMHVSIDPYCTVILSIQHYLRSANIVRLLG